MSNPIPDRLIRAIARAPLIPGTVRSYSYLSSADRTVTSRLRYTLILIAAGLTNQEIADAIGISYAAAQDRVKRLLALYDARNRTHLVAIAIRKGDL